MSKHIDIHIAPTINNVVHISDMLRYKDFKDYSLERVHAAIGDGNEHGQVVGHIRITFKHEEDATIFKLVYDNEIIQRQ